MVDDVVGEEAIANMWKEHYCKLLNSNKDVSCRNKVVKTIKNMSECVDVNIDISDVVLALKQLKLGKTVGIDNLQAEHFMYADKAILCLIAMIINCMILHCYMPDLLMETIIIPIVKDKKKLITDKNNYRPVAITTVFSKMFEMIVLSRYEYMLLTHDNQFGFKSKHSTDLCVFSLKQIIEFYNSMSSPVYVCFLDASKAFDRLNHWVLFSKLIDRGIPLLIVRLFIFWYSKQQFCIKWGGSFSTKFTITNGVRQGGVISPVYFNVYMDQLSCNLIKSGLGCHINGYLVNHLMYADDSCIIAPTPSALQKLLKICEHYGESHTIVYNVLKTKCMAFIPKKYKQLSIPYMFLNEIKLTMVDNIEYLGVTITSMLNDDHDMMRHKRYLYSKGNLIVRNFKLCSDQVKLKLFKTFCYNIYGGHLWTGYKTSDMQALVVSFNDVFRALFNVQRGVSMSEIYVFSGIDHLKVLLRKAMYRFRVRLLKSKNSIIDCITKSTYFCHMSSFSVLWTRELYV